MAQQWRSTVRGHPFVDLPDYSLNAKSRRAGESRQSVDDLAMSVADHGLELDEATAADGNCGLDAMLRNIERLGLDAPPAVKVLDVLRRKGRDAALHVMRIMLLIWVRDNKDVEIVPCVKLTQLIEMETAGRTSAYIEMMSHPRVWIDTPMLLAMSAVFNVQLVVFLGLQEPQLVAAPSVAASPSEVPVCLIANRSNVHFYACRPRPADEAWDDARADELADTDMLGAALADARPMQENDGDANVGCTLGSRKPEPLELKKAENLLCFCEGMATWDAFGHPDLAFADKVRAVEFASQSDLAGFCLETLEWRHAIKMLRWETADGGVAELDRKHRLRKLAISRAGGTRLAEFRKSHKLLGKLAPSKIAESIAAPCEKWNKHHECLAMFRKLPAVVLRWRKVWYALPKADRLARLVEEFTKEMRQRAAANHGLGGDRMCFKFFGQPVCREAFARLTGIHPNTLQEARQVALSGRSLSKGPQAKLSLTYIQARAWLLEYAETHADTSPLRDSLFLPAGRRQYYWAAYYHDRHAKGIPESQVASQSYFLKMWRQEFPWIELRQPSGPFTHCGLCDYLKMAISDAKVGVCLRGQVTRLHAGYRPHIFLVWRRISHGN
jgi:hypothetical protein